MNIFSLKGRIGRGTYFLWILVLSVLMVAFSFLYPLFIEVENAVSVSKALGVIIVVLSIFPAVQRAHDVGKSAMFPLLPMILNSLCIFFPEGTLINSLILGIGGVWGLYVGLCLLFVPGAKTANEYGEARKPSLVGSSSEQQNREQKGLMNNEVGMPATPTVHSDEEDRLYDQIAEEIETDNLVRGVWTRAFAEADGDENRAKAIYIKRRVSQLAEEMNRLEKQKQEKIYGEEAELRRQIRTEVDWSKKTVLLKKLEEIAEKSKEDREAEAFSKWQAEEKDLDPHPHIVNEEKFLEGKSELFKKWYREEKRMKARPVDPLI